MSGSGISRAYMDRVLRQFRNGSARTPLATAAAPAAPVAQGPVVRKATCLSMSTTYWLFAIFLVCGLGIGYAISVLIQVYKKDKVKKKSQG